MPTISSRSPTGCADGKPLARGIARRKGWGDGEDVARRSDAPHDLPVGFRGYDRASTDALLTKLGERSAALTRERDDLRRQVDDLTRDVEDHRRRSEAVADALVTAQRMALDLRANAEAEIAEQRREIEDFRAEVEVQIAEREREVESEREKLVDVGNEIRAEARADATEIVREARIRADRLIDEVLDALRAYEDDADGFLSDSRTRLVSLVRELIERIPGTAPAAPEEHPAEVETEIVAEGDEPHGTPVADSAAA
jgi:cell division septum initiation protein DivIVA